MNTDTIVAVLAGHELAQEFGGIATGSRWYCCCGDQGGTPGTREYARTLHRRHVAGLILKAMSADGVPVADLVLEADFGTYEAPVCGHEETVSMRAMCDPADRTLCITCGHLLDADEAGA